LTDVLTSDEEAMDKVRAPSEVATRALALFSVVAAALGAPRDEIVAWLQEHKLLNALSPSESEFLKAKAIDRQSKVNFGWQSERLLVLLWAIGRVKDLPGPGVQCDTAVFQDILPPFTEIAVAEFVESASLVSDEDLFAKSEELLGQHWKARDAKLNGKSAPDEIDIEVVQERHHAINWITGYCGLPWDEVTTDT
jgi:hypothetical protein